MEPTKEELQRKFDHLADILKLLSERRYILERQAAQQGLQAPPQILMEIQDIAEQIRVREQELVQLKTHLVEDAAPLAEVEYRVLLAETWGTQKFQPSLLGTTKLELARLQLGIKPECARKIEREIRSELASEALSAISWRDVATVLTYISPLDKKESNSIMQEMLHEGDAFESAKRIARNLVRGIVTVYVGDEDMRKKAVETVVQAFWRAISLDPLTAAQAVVNALPSHKALDLLYVNFIGTLLTAPFVTVYRITTRQNDYRQFNLFLNSLGDVLQSRTTEQQTELRMQIDHTIESIRADIQYG
jgi:hypothetical protein